MVLEAGERAAAADVVLLVRPREPAAALAAHAQHGGAGANLRGAAPLGARAARSRARLPARDRLEDAPPPWLLAAGAEAANHCASIRRVRGRLRTWLLGGSLVLGAVASVVYMRPTLVAPIAGDDRANFPWIAAYDDSWSPLSDLEDLPELWKQRAHKGRVTVVAALERRTVARGVMATAIRTDTPTARVLGALKLLLTIASVLTLAALVKSLRWRRRDGALIRASRRTVILCTLAGGVLFALGSQSQFLRPNGRNGWVSYPDPYIRSRRLDLRRGRSGAVADPALRREAPPRRRHRRSRGSRSGLELSLRADIRRSPAVGHRLGVGAVNTGVTEQPRGAGPSGLPGWRTQAFFC